MGEYGFFIVSYSCIFCLPFERKPWASAKLFLSGFLEFLGKKIRPFFYELGFGSAKTAFA